MLKIDKIVPKWLLHGATGCASGVNHYPEEAVSAHRTSLSFVALLHLVVNQALLSSSSSSQWVLGLLFFLFPVTSSWLRVLYLPFHVFCGLTLLVMAIGTSLLGITEKLLFSISYVPIFLLFIYLAEISVNIHSDAGGLASEFWLHRRRSISHVCSYKHRGRLNKGFRVSLKQ